MPDDPIPSPVPSRQEKYRKKPVEIEAWHYDGSIECARAIIAWAHEGLDALANARILIAAYAFDGYVLSVRTLGGEVTARNGDWIIRGVQGEFYPCKPDIFAATYEPAADPAGLVSPRAQVDALVDVAVAAITLQNPNAEDAAFRLDMRAMRNGFQKVLESSSELAPVPQQDTVKAMIAVWEREFAGKASITALEANAHLIFRELEVLRECVAELEAALAASAGRETEPLDNDDRDEADAILQSVLVMLGLPGFRKEWFVNDRWNFGALRQHGLDARLAEIRAAEKLAAGRETAPPISPPQHAITCPQHEWAKRGDKANGLGLWGDPRCTCGPETPAPPSEPEDYKALYFDLLFQVGTVYPGQSRHETAKRYLQRAEESTGQSSASAPAGETK